MIYRQDISLLSQISQALSCRGFLHKDEIGPRGLRGAVGKLLSFYNSAGSNVYLSYISMCGVRSIRL